MRLVFACLYLSAVLSAQVITQQNPSSTPVPGSVSRGVMGGAPGADQRAVSSDCAIDGLVVNKITGEPIPRAVIVLRSASTTGDNAGRFSFTNIPCGTVPVMANRPGFLNYETIPQGAGSGPRPLVMAPASALHDVKVELTPQAVVVGKVTDDNGDPAPGAQVLTYLSQVVQGRRTFMSTASSTADDLGNFRAAGLQRGRYVFCARGGNQIRLKETMYGETCYPGGIEGGTATAIDMAAGGQTRIDFTLHTVRSVHIRGTLTGIPKIQSVPVNLVRRAPGGMLDSGGGGHPTTMQREGKFQIADVAPGSYLLTSDYFESGRGYVARVPVEVGNSDLEDVTVRLEPFLTVTGNVRFESNATNFSNVALNQINVNLHATESLGGRAVQWNKDHSAFTVPELAPGNYRLDGYAPARLYVKSAMLGGRDISRVAIPISQNAGPIDVVLGDDGGTLEGQVTGEGDQPVTCWVMLLSEGRQPRNIRTDSSGKFKATGLAPGEYRVYAWDDMQQVEYENPEWMRHYPVSVITVDANQSAQVKLKESIVEAR